MRTIPKTDTDPAMEQFAKKFSLPKKPGAELPDLPANLDDLSEADLMEVYREFTAWLIYAKAELVKAEIAEDREANRCRAIEAKVLIEQGSSSSEKTVTLAKARRDTDERVIGQQEKYQVARAYKKLVDSVYDRCDRGSQLLSRELTRRTSGGAKFSRSGP